MSGPRVGFRSRESLGLGDRPGWLTTGIVRLLVLCVLIVLIAMLRPHLDRHSAAVVCIAFAVVAVAGAALFLGVTRRVARRFAFLDPGHQIADAVAVLLRRTGLPLLGLVFFLAWTIVYLALWAAHPHDAFTGLGPDPRFADLFYYSVSTAFISPPGDIIAHSRGVRAATLIEMLTGFGLLSAYLSTFVDFRGGGRHGAHGGAGGAAATGAPAAAAGGGEGADGGTSMGDDAPPPAEGRGDPTPGT